MRGGCELSNQHQAVRRTRNARFTPDVLRRVDAKIRSLADDPRPHGCIKLAGMEGYRVRVGDYRIIYTVDDTAHVVEIIAVDLRERVYRCGKRRS